MFGGYFESEVIIMFGCNYESEAIICLAIALKVGLGYVWRLL